MFNVRTNDNNIISFFYILSNSLFCDTYQQVYRSSHTDFPDKYFGFHDWNKIQKK
jgi:hypothetical protein